MTLQECYAEMQGDYEDVMRRIPSAALIEKFALKFLEDPNFEELQQAKAGSDPTEMIRPAHTIKGVAGNLGFTALYKSSEELVKLLRAEQYEEAEQAYEKTIADCQRTLDAIRKYQAEKA